VVEFVGVRAGRLVHVAELVAAEPVHLVSTLVAAEAAEVAEVVVAVFGHQPTAVGHLFPAAATVAVVLVGEDGVEHVLDTHPDEPAREQDDNGGRDSGPLGDGHL